jgi:hypothetical protein
MRCRVALAAMLLVSLSAEAGQKKLEVVSTVDQPEIAGRRVQVDAQGKLLPWPMPDNVGYWLNRRSLSGSREKAAGKTLIATSRPSRVSRARYTSPMPPAPSGD